MGDGRTWRSYGGFAIIGNGKCYGYSIVAPHMHTWVRCCIWGGWHDWVDPTSSHPKYNTSPKYACEVQLWGTHSISPISFHVKYKSSSLVHLASCIPSEADVQAAVEWVAAVWQKKNKNRVGWVRPNASFQLYFPFFFPFRFGPNKPRALCLSPFRSF